MKKHLLQLTALGISGGLLILLAILLNPTVTFQSWESKTENHLPVFNEIKWIPGLKKDIWLMKQNQHPADLPKENWDRLAIVVDKTASPKIAKFYQLSKGDFDVPNPETESIPLKARCFSCHSNGPRAIRMDLDSQVFKPSLSQRLTVAVWNLRIKSYGVLHSQEGKPFPSEGAPFQSSLSLLKQTIELKSCVRCHSPQGLRNTLTWEQAGSIRFLVEKNEMPPFPFTLSSRDRKILQQMTGLDR